MVMDQYRARPGKGVAWVTGASSGIGRETALRLAEEGFLVAATARSEDALNELATRAPGGRIESMPGDVTDASAMAGIAETLAGRPGGLALCVFNAGVYLPVRGDRLELEPFEKTFAVNLRGVVNGLVPAVAAMKAAGGGHIVIVSSVTGYGGLPTSAAYGASKAALINMAESLKFDFDRINIRIQVVNPGFVDTPATQDNRFTMPALIQPQEAARRIVAGIGTGGFEITFPKRFTYWLKALSLLPYGAYFGLLGRATGWKKRSTRRGGKA